MYDSDCLSRASIQDENPSPLHDPADSYINSVLGNLPCTDRRLEQIKQLQQEDEICIKICQYVVDDWPNKIDLPTVLLPYYQFRDYFSVQNGLLLKGDRILIPTCMRLEMLDLLHDGHFGIQKTRDRAIRSVYWPGISSQIEEMVKNCRICAKHKPDRAEPLKPTPLPDRPWQKVGADLFQIRGCNYLVVVDYYSRYIEMAKLDKNTTSSNVIMHLKSIFARHGVPEVVISDNGSNLANQEMDRFATLYNFVNITSSPRYPRANGSSEAALKRCKQMIEKSSDPYRALLAYRTTPIHNGYSPAELCMGRQLRSPLPTAPHLLDIKNEDPAIRQKEEKYKNAMKKNYDSRHNAKELPTLHPGDHVIIRDNKREAIVEKPAENSPRSTVVNTPEKSFRRNRRSLIKLPKESPTQNETLKSTSKNVITTRSGRVVRPPEKLHTPEIQPV